MKIIKQQTGHSSSLILFFSGWSVPPVLFTRLKAEEGTDVVICYDYRDLRFEEDLTAYKTIHLIAWSMGVRIAELATAGKYTFASATAINGTPCPIHDAYGIPENIFRGTLGRLSPEGMKRFNRRMCGSREICAQYEAFPARPLEETRDELQHIYMLCQQEAEAGPPASVSSIPWTRAVIGSGDLIFPAANQRNYWQRRCPVTEIDAPHYPFYLWKQWNEL